MVSNLTVKIGADIAGLQKELNKATGALQGFQTGLKSISNQLKGLAAGFGLMEIGRGVITTTSEFQKFSAVLENTLGSNSQAQKALNDIKEFAAATPFSVQELTGAFVKLANQGFTPTVNELRKLGDLASSTGKSFDQLAEAIIDAQTGEFERLKEFGIRAQKEGDKVTFTFKGVKKQVDFTSEAIRQYVLSLGDSVGVSGSMAKISETLGGKISNLGDAWDSLMLSIGNGSAGPISAAIESLTVLTNALANLSAESELIKQAISPFHDLKDVSKETLDYLIKFGRTDTGKRVADVLKPFTSQENRQFLIEYDKNFRAFVETLQKEGESLEDINVLWAHYVKTRIEAVKVDNADLKQGRLDAVLKQKEAAKAALGIAKAEASIKERLARANKINTPTQNITGAGFLNDLGMLDSAANQVSAAMSKINTSMINGQQTIESWGESARIQADKVAKKFVDVAPIIQSAIASGVNSIATAMGEAFAGVGNFGDAILKAVGSFAQQFGSALIAAGVAAAVAQKALLTNPYAAIAAGVALVAVGASLAATAKKAHSDLFSGGAGASGASNGNLAAPRFTGSNSVQDSNPKLITVLKGQDIWIALENYRIGNGFTRA